MNEWTHMSRMSHVACMCESCRISELCHSRLIHIYDTTRPVRFWTSIYRWVMLYIYVESCHIYVIYMSWVMSKISSGRVVSYIWMSHVTHTWNVQVCHVIYMSWVILLESESITSYRIWVIYVIWVLQRISVSSLNAWAYMLRAAKMSVLQCVAVCCSVFQCLPSMHEPTCLGQQRQVCCSVLQCVAACFSVFPKCTSLHA